MPIDSTRRAGISSGFKQFSPPGWTGHGGIDTSIPTDIVNCFWINKQGFQKNVDEFIRGLPELLKIDFPSAMWLAESILFRICQQEAPRIYETIITLCKRVDEDDRLTQDQAVALINAKLKELLRHAEKARGFFERVRQAAPRWNLADEVFEDAIYQIILQEKEADWRRRHPPGD